MSYYKMSNDDLFIRFAIGLLMLAAFWLYQWMKG